MNRSRLMWMAAAVALSTAGLTCLSTTSPAQDAGKQDSAENKSQPPDLVTGLKATPGCMGVETARTQSGKNVIFAWFENRKAVLAWYKSNTHKYYMEMFGGAGRPPMAQVPDDVPLLCIASITPSKEQKIPGAHMPISQISIELYTVVPGGASVGGTFAPKGLKIPNHHNYDDDPKADSTTAEKAESKP